MININLLPYRHLRRQQQLQKILAAWAVSAVVGIMISSGVHTYMLSEVEDREAVKQQNAAKIQSLDTQLGEIKKLEKMKADLQKRLDVVADLSKNRDLPERILSELSHAIPDNVWLKSLEVKPDRILFVGISGSNKDIADFMINLGRSAIFTNVELGRSSDEMVDGILLKSFEMNLIIKPPSSADPLPK